MGNPARKIDGPDSDEEKLRGTLGDARALLESLLQRLPLQEPPRAPGSRRYSRSFWTALAGLHAHGVPDAHAGHVQELWHQLAALNPSEPDLTLEEGVKFTWMGDRYTLEVEVLSDGGKAWYFRDAAQPLGVSEGAENEPAYDLPERFWQCFRMAGAERGGR